MKSFTETVGSGTKNKIPQYEYKNGEHHIRIFGDVLPRYIYWVKNPKTGKDMPVECLGFDRDEEAFLNAEKDWVREYFPGDKCTWAYAMLCLDLNGSEPEVKVLNLKRKLFEQIKTLASEELGDPTDLEKGWDVYFKREKTGPHAFNVEYTVQQLKCGKAVRAVTDEERELIENAPSIDEVLPRVTPEKQKEFLDRMLAPDEENTKPSDEVSKEFEGEESPSDLSD